MSTAITPPAEPAAFDHTKFIKEQNEAEAARRSGKELPKSEPAPVPGKPAPIPEVKVDEAKPVDGDPEDHEIKNRGDRRRMNQLMREAAEAKGRADTLQELIRTMQSGKAPAAPVKDENAEPNRNDFKTDAEYTKAIAQFTAKQEIGKVSAENRTVEETRDRINAASETHEEQWKLIPGSDKILNEANDFKFNKNPINVQYVLAISKVRPHVVEYFVAHADEWEELNAIDSEVEQRAFFHQIEGEVKAVYRERQKKAKVPIEEKAKLSAAERDAAKARPSEAITPKGGEGSDGTVSMMLADGKTLNPAWKTAQNEREGRRR